MASLKEVIVESSTWRLKLGMHATNKLIISHSQDPPPVVPEGIEKRVPPPPLFVLSVLRER
jgi:hypothetical protein